MNVPHESKVDVPKGHHVVSFKESKQYWMLRRQWIIFYSYNKGRDKRKEILKGIVTEELWNGQQTDRCLYYGLKFEKMCI